MIRSSVHEPWSTLSCNQSALDGCAASLSKFLRDPVSGSDLKRVVLIVGEPGAGRSAFLSRLLWQLDQEAESQPTAGNISREPNGLTWWRDAVGCEAGTLRISRHVGSGRLAMVDMISSLGAQLDVTRSYKRIGRSSSSIPKYLQHLIRLRGCKAFAMHDLDSYAVECSNINKKDLALMLRLPTIQALLIEISPEQVGWAKEALRGADVEYYVIALERMMYDATFESFVIDIIRLYGKDAVFCPDSEVLSALYKRSKGRVGKLVELIKLEMLRGRCVFREEVPRTIYPNVPLEGESFSSWLWRISQISGHLELKLAYDQLLNRHVEIGCDIDGAFNEQWIAPLVESVLPSLTPLNDTREMYVHTCAAARAIHPDAHMVQGRGQGQCLKNLEVSIIQEPQDAAINPTESVLRHWFECQVINSRPLAEDLNYCPCCLDDDIRRIGSPAWRIAWRNMDVCVCDRHPVPVLLQRLYSPQANLMNRGWSAFVEFHDGPAARLEIDFPLTLVSLERSKAANAQLLDYVLRTQRWIVACDESTKEGGPSKAAIEFLLSFWLYQPGNLKAVGFAQSFFFAHLNTGKSSLLHQDCFADMRLGYSHAAPRQVAVAYLMLGVAFDLLTPEEAAFISRTCRGRLLPFPTNREQIAASGQSGFVPKEIADFRSLAQAHLVMDDLKHVMWALNISV